MDVSRAVEVEIRELVLEGEPAEELVRAEVARALAAEPALRGQTERVAGAVASAVEEGARQ